MELWRSFFQDSRNRPVDKFGKEASAPKCTMCEGTGDYDGKLCPKCKGERVDSESIPTYSDEIQKVSREYPDGESSVSVTWEAVADFRDDYVRRRALMMDLLNGIPSLTAS